MARKSTLSKVALGLAATSAAGVITLGSLGVQPQNTESIITTIAQGSVAEYFSLKAESEDIETKPNYEIIEITEPVTIAPETTAPIETTTEVTTVKTTAPPQTTTTIAPTTYKSEQTVYWVKSGEVYHVTSNCRTLKRSKTIYKGTISESRKSRVCKVCGEY